MKYAIKLLLLLTYFLSASSIHAPASLNELVQDTTKSVSTIVTKPIAVSKKFYIDFKDNKTTTKIVDVIKEDTTVIETDTVQLDTTSASKFNKYFRDSSDLRNFCLYIKTQSINDGDNTWITIQVMFNRLDFYNCKWHEYYNNESWNHSNTIRLLKAGKCKKTFKLSDKYDKILYHQVQEVLAGRNPVNVPQEVFSFEACKRSPNSTAHKLSKLWRSIRSIHPKVPTTRYYTR